MEARQLSCLVLYRPQENLSDPGSLELDQFVGALGRCSNEQSLAQQLNGATQSWTHHLNEEFFGQLFYYPPSDSRTAIPARVGKALAPYRHDAETGAVAPRRRRTMLG